MSELAIVNEVGQAVAAQLDLGTLIELVGDQMRSTFEADIVYVALARPGHRDDRFPYYSEGGAQRTPGADTPSARA